MNAKTVLTGFNIAKNVKKIFLPVMMTILHEKINFQKYDKFDSLFTFDNFYDGKIDETPKQCLQTSISRKMYKIYSVGICYDHISRKIIRLQYREIKCKKNYFWSL